MTMTKIVTLESLRSAIGVSGLVRGKLLEARGILLDPPRPDGTR